MALPLPCRRLSCDCLVRRPCVAGALEHLVFLACCRSIEVKKKNENCSKNIRKTEYFINKTLQDENKKAAKK
jgi:hypothetical protein